MRFRTTASVAAVVAAFFGTTQVGAQQVTGTLGSPSATTTISNEQLPAPDRKFGGVIRNDALQSKPGGRRVWCRRRVRRTCC